MKFAQARPLLEQLCWSARASGQPGDLIRYLGLAAIALQGLDQQREAQQTLIRSLSLAEPAGHVRTFVDMGTPLLPILQQCPLTIYQESLIDAIGQATETTPPATPSSILIEPLSTRELDVLHLLSSHLSGPEIAETLIISPNTLKTHTRNIYGKLDVRSRSDAIDRARRLHLI